MERRLLALEARVGQTEQVQGALVEAVEAAAQDEGAEDAGEGVATMTLDGEHVGGERDTSQSLDG